MTMPACLLFGPTTCAESSRSSTRMAMASSPSTSLTGCTTESGLEELESLAGKPSLDFNEFLFFYDSISERSSCDNEDGDLAEAFKVFDLNGDGFISSEELQSVLSRLGLWEETGGGDCRNMIRMYDANSDGVLDFEEFKSMMLLTIS